MALYPYRGTAKGRGDKEASQLGTLASGLCVEAQSLSGKIVIVLSQRNGQDWAHIYTDQHLGHGGPSRTLYDGPVNPSDADLYTGLDHSYDTVAGLSEAALNDSELAATSPKWKG